MLPETRIPIPILAGWGVVCVRRTCPRARIYTTSSILHRGRKVYESSQHHGYSMSVSSATRSSFKRTTFATVMQTFLALSVMGQLSGSFAGFADTGPYPASYAVFSPDFHEPPVPEVVTDFKSHFIQHKWFVSPIPSGHRLTRTGTRMSLTSFQVTGTIRQC